MTMALALLGSTGSIGTQVLDVVRHFPDRFHVAALAAGKNLNLLVQQVKAFNPAKICIGDEADEVLLRQLLTTHAPQFSGEIFYGKSGLNQLASDTAVEAVVVGLVGLRGLEPTLTALTHGKKVITANKETFVAGGHLVQPYLKENRIISIDSEHVALHQCIAQGSAQSNKQAIDTLYLTASGGPFREFSVAAMTQVGVADALQHPNWVMGAKITVDCATMMNKGLEVIEAHWLFNTPYKNIQILVHPESLVHGGVRFVDGSVLMQIAPPDMRGPIQYALTYPERFFNPEPSVHLDLLTVSQLNFEKPNPDRFPCIRLAYEAGQMKGSATAVLNSADEVAVKLFLEEKIPFLHIAKLIEDTLTAHQKEGIIKNPDLETIIALDEWTQQFIAQQQLTLK
jgi:1-deoxy-D-xylulose-5-phosphate reductoisomerase